MKRNANYLKSLLQWGALLSIVFVIIGSLIFDRKVDVEAYCPFGGLQALGSFWVNHSLACSMSMIQIMMGVALAAGVVLFSKLFCGYLCPMGTVSEWLGRQGRRWNVQREPKARGWADRLLRGVKYLALFWILYNTLSTSELFCKKLDPYYAVATGFQGEIVAWMSTLTLTLLVLGNVFVRMFWCRYICPLGALSNFFKFTPLAVLAGGVVWLLSALGIPDAWQWTLAVSLAVSYAWEVLHLKSHVFPLLHITRDADACTSCGACDRKCPYHLPISREERVMQVDCTLCGACLATCPTHALSVNHRPKWRYLPAMLCVALFAVGITLGMNTELPTIDEKWGGAEELQDLETYKLDGLMSVKCFGSSKALAAKLQSVRGIYGLRTFVRRHGVEILYDPATIDSVAIRGELFTPTQRKYKTPPATCPSLRVFDLGIEGLHDRMDMVYFGMALQQVKGIYGYTSEFDCPIHIRIFADPKADHLTEEYLTQVIEAEELVFHTPKGDKVFPMHNEVQRFAIAKDEISRRAFTEMMFSEVAAIRGRFRENLAKWGDSTRYTRAIYELPYPQIEKVLVRQGVPYFKSFLSCSEGILALDFALDEQLTPVMRLTYVPEVTNDERIWREILSAPKWRIRMKDGTMEESAPRMKFKKKGVTRP